MFSPSGIDGCPQRSSVVGPREIAAEPTASCDGPVVPAVQAVVAGPSVEADHR
ncbi:MAG: hypothetical protein LBV30_10695 [Propionibacteriaceae bacterium]|nr:hypothetical protein [Propionibacteriaceae bacterium]